MGLGVGLRDRQSEQGASFTTSLNTPMSTSASSPTPVPLINGALNDTSIASIQISDGSRHLFFQDINGTIRHAGCSGLTNQWLPSITFIPTPQQPRNHTPISAIEVVETNTPNKVINIYYVDAHNALAAVQYSISGNADGSTLNTTRSLLDSTFLVSTATRSLSVARLQCNLTELSAPGSGVPMQEDGSLALNDQIFLFYENPEGNITVLQGLYNYTLDGSVVHSGWTWSNVSNLLYPNGTTQRGWMSSPFSVWTVTRGAFGSLSGYFFNALQNTSLSSLLPPTVHWSLSNASACESHFFSSSNMV